MIDIHFYMKANDLKKRLMFGAVKDKASVIDELESCRSKSPVVFNIETTNACNMRCTMCPRTTKMTRPVKTLNLGTYRQIVEQLTPFTVEEWQQWEAFAERNYGITNSGMSENHFFLYVIPRVVILHGYGDPLLDPHISQRVQLLTERGIPSYFSCNPANINVDKTLELFANGLSYIKYSIDSVDDERIRTVRGSSSNFSESYAKILQLLELKEKRGYSTVIVITMIDLDNSWQQQDYEKLQSAFKDKPVYLYMKSLDQQWYTNDAKQNQSIHWTEFCQFPWSSMTIMANGLVSSCGQDYNCDIVLGDARIESLYDIWNGAAYQSFRKSHLNLSENNKCTLQCDMTMAGRLIL